MVWGTLRVLLLLGIAYDSHGATVDVHKSWTKVVSSHKPAAASTVLKVGDRISGAVLANDGNYSPYLTSGTGCYSSIDGDMNPFWYVDLEGDYCIFRVSLTNTDQNAERLRNIVIDVLSAIPTASTPTGQLCGTVDGNVGAGQTVAVYCPVPNGNSTITGRYVRVRKSSMEDSQDRLTLCEVQVISLTFRDRVPTSEFPTGKQAWDAHGNRFYGWTGRVYY